MFEVVIAIFIMALIIVGVVILATNSIANSTFSKNKTLAGRYTQEAIEWLRGQRDAGMTLFKEKVSPTPYCLDTLVWTNTGTCGDAEIVAGTTFKRQLNLTESLISGKNVIEATVVVFWDDAKGNHEVRSVTNFTDIREK